MKSDKLAVEPPLQIDLPSDSEAAASGIFDLDRILFDQDTGIKALSNHADSLDCLVSIASGLLCGALDLLWVGEFSLAAGREYASDRVEGLVQKTAKMFGCREDGTRACVAFLEKNSPSRAMATPRSLAAGCSITSATLPIIPPLWDWRFPCSRSLQADRMAPTPAGIFSLLRCRKKAGSSSGMMSPPKS